MKRFTAVLLVLTLVSFVAVPLLAEEDGAALFKKSCAPCHGPTGNGDTAMGKKLGVKALNSAEAQKLTDEQLKQVISKGKGKMPSFGGKFTPDQLKAVIAFIRTLKK